ncbi:phytoene/squalene synthase family protein [Nesterenkonia marinintestina]|uniref:phytoene/squalene synthase family protein n=1 Tax=Nesterenkonia marinintestina TaxID=2979865 RepID=UPI0021BEF867|nr:squalene/phytoene synthase family protein [Nesterenkonia sp. GX14115]
MSAEPSPARRFTRTADAAADDVIDAYSTSFGWATRLLGRRHRAHVRSIYALVRVADEIVDGTAAGFGLGPEAQAETLDRYEAETRRAMASGFSTDLVIHSFARTARQAGIDTTLTGPFFESMRADLSGSPADAGERDRYVYGSAEVVGLMCLRVFLREETPSPAERARLEVGARRLGAAFQNVNFLRDLAADSEDLGRNYLSDRGVLTVEEHQAWVRTIAEQLDAAAAVIPLLPRDCRAAVTAAHLFFAELLRRLAATPTHELRRRRIRVPDPVKLRLLAQALAPTGPALRPTPTRSTR